MLPDSFSRHRFCEILSRTVTVYASNFPTFLLIGVLSLLPSFLFSLYLAFQVRHFMDDLGGAFIDFSDDLKVGGGIRRFLEEDFDMNMMLSPQDMGADIQSLVRKAVIVSLLYYIVQLVLQAAINLATVNVYLQRTTSPVDLLKDSIPRVPSLLCLGVWFLLGLSVIMIAFLIVEFLAFAIARALLGDLGTKLIACISVVGYLWAYFHVVLGLLFVGPIVVIERASALDAIKRSLDLSRGHRLTIFCVLIVFGSAAFAVQALVGFLVYVFGSDPVLLSISLSAVSAVLFPLGMITIAVLYINARVINEGCNAEVMARNVSPEDADAYKRSSGATGYKDVPTDEDLPSNGGLPIAQVIV